jgi:hypothetical protein
MPLEVPAGATVAAVVARFALPMKMVHLVLIDGVYVPPEERATRPLVEGETLAIWPPHRRRLSQRHVPARGGHGL